MLSTLATTIVHTRSTSPNRIPFQYSQNTAAPGPEQEELR